MIKYIYTFFILFEIQFIVLQKQVQFNLKRQLYVINIRFILKSFKNQNQFFIRLFIIQYYYFLLSFNNFFLGLNNYNCNQNIARKTISFIQKQNSVKVLRAIFQLQLQLFKPKKKLLNDSKKQQYQIINNLIKNQFQFLKLLSINLIFITYNQRFKLNQTYFQSTINQISKSIKKVQIYFIIIIIAYLISLLQIIYNYSIFNFGIKKLFIIILYLISVLARYYLQQIYQ
eukprot:TRINITY_DN37753_c2_g1_i1.p1 TRINITY_DN37753_c2_g1~~TRINITY_DN37753_c2_g1_i1.p1  ORF type:complete len:229 (+),score=-14.51 TRINITY_DN37753_c2_g1_i1:282-968(+)